MMGFGGLHLCTVAAGDDLARAVDELQARGWPPFMLEDNVAWSLWPRLMRDFPHLQLALVDDENRVVAAGNAIAFGWDGDEASFPWGGWDDVLVRGFADLDSGRPLNAASFLGIVVAPEHRGRGLSRLMVRALKAAAAQAGARAVVAPVRPSLKARYPLTPIERYVTWTGDDGLPFDPWLRVHVRLGGQILRVCERSMRIAWPVSAWERWTGLAFPESGRYVVPDALVPLDVDRERDEAVYVEPNVWVQHPL